MTFDTIYNILSSEAFISVNKTMARKIGLIPAVVLAELISEQKYWTYRKELDENGFFFSTISNLEKNCGISRGKQDTAIKELIEKNLILYKVKQYPRRRFFKINNYEVFKLLQEEYKEEEEDLSIPDLTKVRKNVRIFIETFSETYKKIDKDYFQFLQLSENYKLTKEDVEAVSKLDDKEIDKLTKSLEDINYTLDHSGMINNWKEGMVFSIRLIFKIEFRLNAWLSYCNSLKE